MKLIIFIILIASADLIPEYQTASVKEVNKQEVNTDIRPRKRVEYVITVGSGKSNKVNFAVKFYGIDQNQLNDWTREFSLNTFTGELEKTTTENDVYLEHIFRVKIKTTPTMLCKLFLLFSSSNQIFFEHLTVKVDNKNTFFCNLEESLDIKIPHEFIRNCTLQHSDRSRLDNLKSPFYIPYYKNFFVILLILILICFILFFLDDFFLDQL